MKISSKTVSSVLLAVSFSVAGAVAWAQDAPMTNSQNKMDAMAHPHHGMMKDGHSMKGMKGMHAMPATVTSVDKATGEVEVMAEKMSLRVHFPPASIADLNNGDQITLHMGYSKP